MTLLTGNPQSCDVSTGSTNQFFRYPIPVPEVLNNDSKLEEVLWNFSRFDLERRLMLSQNPHFYNDLPTSSNANWGEFNANAIEGNWHTYHTKPIFVLTNIPGRVFLELCRKPRVFDNVWNVNETLIFKSKCLTFRFFFYLDVFPGGCGRLEGEDIVRASIQHSLGSWCDLEHLASEPWIAKVRPNQSSHKCVLVEKWTHKLRQALLSQNNPNFKLRITECTHPILIISTG